MQARRSYVELTGAAGADIAKIPLIIAPAQRYLKPHSSLSLLSRTLSKAMQAMHYIQRIAAFRGKLKWQAVQEAEVVGWTLDKRMASVQIEMK